MLLAQVLPTKAGEASSGFVSHLLHNVLIVTEELAMQRAILNLFLDRSIRLPLILERLNYSEILHCNKIRFEHIFFSQF